MDADVQVWWVDNVECSVYMQYSCTDLLFLGLYPLFHMLQYDCALQSSLTSWFHNICCLCTRDVETNCHWSAKCMRTEPSYSLQRSQIRLQNT